MPLNTIFPVNSLPSANSVGFDGQGLDVPEMLPVAASAPATLPESTGARAERDRPAAGPWIGCSEQTGVVEIHDPRMFRAGREAFCRALAEAAVYRFQAVRVVIRLECSTCLLEFEPGRFDRSGLAGLVAEAVRAATAAACDASGCRNQSGGARWTVLTAIAMEGGASIDEARDDFVAEVDVAELLLEEPTGSGWLTCLALAGGSLTLAIAGAILPGIPTFPFLMMTGHYALRVCPRLERLLKRQPWFAALLDKAEISSGLNLDWRSMSKMVGLAAVLAAAFLIVHPPLPVVVGLEFALMAFMAWREMDQPGSRKGGLAAAA